MSEEISPIGPMRVQLEKDDYTFPLKNVVPWEDWKKITETIPEDMCWRKSALRQNGVFDSLKLGNAVACSSHTSKSCKLPVVRGVVAPGVVVIIRGNFYDWKVSVISDHPLPGIDDTYLFEPETHHRSVYFEGFDNAWCFGSYKNNQQQFSVELEYDPLRLYTFVRELRRVSTR